MQGRKLELHNRIIFDTDVACTDPCILCSILVDRMSKTQIFVVQKATIVCVCILYLQHDTV